MDASSICWHNGSTRQKGSGLVISITNKTASFLWKNAWRIVLKRSFPVGSSHSTIKYGTSSTNTWIRLKSTPMAAMKSLSRKVSETNRVTMLLLPLCGGPQRATFNLILSLEVSDPSSRKIWTWRLCCKRWRSITSPTSPLENNVCKTSVSAKILPWYINFRFTRRRCGSCAKAVRMSRTKAVPGRVTSPNKAPESWWILKV